MEITCNAAKNQANAEKHGVPLSAAVEFEWENALTWPDERQSYGEERMCAIGYIKNRLYYLVYVNRSDVRRIISLRRANSREVERYAEA